MPKNFFAALDSDDDDTPTTVAAPAPAPARRANNNNNNNRRRTGGRRNNGGRVDGDYRATRDNRGAERRQPHRGGRRENPPRRGRQFDRHVSGTGRGKGMKRGGRGVANWGAEDENTESYVQADLEATKGEEGEEGAAAGEEGEESKAPPAPKVKSLADYEAERAAAVKHAEAFGAAAARSVDDVLPGSSIKAKYDDGDDPTAQYEDSAVQPHQKGKGRREGGASSKRGQAALDQVFRTQSYLEEQRSQYRRRDDRAGGRGGRRFEGGNRRFDGNRRGGRGGRGGRGRGRGGRGGRGSRGGVPNIQDESAFPALG